MNTSLTPHSDATAVELKPLEFPLQGSSLIEASAGTGKTFTIAMLYVRLVLGQRGSDSEARALDAARNPRRDVYRCGHQGIA